MARNIGLGVEAATVGALIYLYSTGATFHDNSMGLLLSAAIGFAVCIIPILQGIVLATQINSKMASRMITEGDQP